MVILTAIIIGVWSMIFLGAFTRGAEVGMIKNGISTLTGNLQIHHKNYRKDPVIENSMTDVNSLESALKTVLPDGAKWSMRVRVNAIVANARHSSGITLVGIDPPAEAAVSFIGGALKNGRYLKPEDKAKIVVGQALLDKFETKIGHKLVLMSQDTEREIASKAFRIVGTFRSEMEATEKAVAFVNMASVRKMLKLKEGVSEVSILLPDQRLDSQTESQVAKELKAKLNNGDFVIETWQDLLPIMKAYLELVDGFLYIWYLVVFIAMGFGIVNTMLMAIFERMREFGLMKALGMKPRWIVRSVLTESFFLLVIGLSIGNILGIFSVAALSRNGLDLSLFAAGTEMWGMTRVIIPEIWQNDIIAANLVVFLLGLLVSIYPAVKAARFTPVEALTKI
jgi:ABC-type lipoprotein release transport system permease subunit